jgi:hypothetical protein
MRNKTCEVRLGQWEEQGEPQKAKGQAVAETGSQEWCWAAGKAAVTAKPERLHSDKIRVFSKCDI